MYEKGEESWIQNEITRQEHAELEFASYEAREKVIGKIADGIINHGYPRLGVRLETHGSHIDQEFINYVRQELPKLVVEGILRLDLGFDLVDAVNLSNEIKTKEDSRKNRDKEGENIPRMEYRSIIREPSGEFENFDTENLGKFFPRIKDGISREIIERYIKDKNIPEQRIRRYIYTRVSDYVYYLERSEKYSSLTNDLDFRNKFHMVFGNQIMPVIEAHLQILRKQISNIQFPEYCSKDQKLNYISAYLGKIKSGVTQIISHRMPAVDSMALGNIRLNHHEVVKLVSQMPYGMTTRQFLQRVGDINSIGLQIDKQDLNLSVRSVLSNNSTDLFLDISPIIMVQNISRVEHLKFEGNLLKGLAFGKVGSNQSFQNQTEEFAEWLNLAAIYVDCIEENTENFIWGSHIKTGDSNRRSYVDLNFVDERSNQDTRRNFRITRALENSVLIIYDPINGLSKEIRFDPATHSENFTILREIAERKLLGHTI